MLKGCKKRPKTPYTPSAVYIVATHIHEWASKAPELAYSGYVHLVKTLQTCNRHLLTLLSTNIK